MQPVGRHRLATMAVCAAAIAAASVLASPTSGAPVDLTKPAARDTEPVVLSGRDFAPWSTLSNQTAKAPLTDLTECQSFDEACKHNHYAEPEVDSQKAAPLEGTPVDRLLGYRWDRRRAQVRADPVPGGRGVHALPRQLGVGLRRLLRAGPAHDLRVRPRGLPLHRERPAATRASRGRRRRSRPTPSPGLDDNDELAFMAARRRARGAGRRRAAARASRRRARSPDRPDRPERSAGLRLRDEGRRRRAAGRRFDAAQRLRAATSATRTPTSSRSRSRATTATATRARGPVCDADGNVVRADGRDARRPRDYATITTARYRFRYDGRWLMTRDRDLARRRRDVRPRPRRPLEGARVPAGPELGDAVLRLRGGGHQLGRLEHRCSASASGPVRAIRETWGADSGTNVIRRETFYRDEMRQKTFLRVHVDPAARRHLRPVGLQRRADDALLQLAEPRRAWTIDGRNDEVCGQPRRSVQPELRRSRIRTARARSTRPTATPTARCRACATSSRTTRASTSRTRRSAS